MYVGTFSYFVIAAWMVYLPASVWDAMDRSALGKLCSAIWHPATEGIAALVRSLRLGWESSAVRLGSITTQYVAAGLLAYILFANAIHDLPRGVRSALGPLSHVPRL